MDKREVRTHSRYATLAPRVDAETFHRVVRAQNLVAGRLDRDTAFASTPKAFSI